MQTSARTVPDTTLVEHDPRWARVLARDASADGQFVYAVKTTGVYSPEKMRPKAAPTTVRVASRMSCVG